MINKSKGFTLVELLLVIGIIATLAVVVFVALDPGKRFQDARNARRNSDIETILSAVYQTVIDSKGVFPTGLNSGEEWMLGTAGSGCANSDNGCATTGDACLDLMTSSGSNLTRYLKAVPFDPQSGSAAVTLYTIGRDINGIITVKACGAEETTIAVSR